MIFISVEIALYFWQILLLSVDDVELVEIFWNNGLLASWVCNVVRHKNCMVSGSFAVKRLGGHIIALLLCFRCDRGVDCWLGFYVRYSQVPKFVDLLLLLIRSQKNFVAILALKVRLPALQCYLDRTFFLSHNFQINTLLCKDEIFVFSWQRADSILYIIV